MASGAAVLALKATAVVTVLAVLILPSFGRCPSLGPEPPLLAPPPPAPAPPPPAPAPSPPATAPPLPAPSPPAAAPPLPAWGPGSGPAPALGIFCSDCPVHCGAECSVTVKAKCSSYCEPPPSCDACKSRELEKCRAACCGNGTCSCDCDSTVAGTCHGDCYVQYTRCRDCQNGEGRLCSDSCNSRCAATCV